MNLVDEKKDEKCEEKPFILPYGSYSIDAIILRVKTNKARNWTEKFIEKSEDFIPIKIMVRANPYRTLQLLWIDHMRVALRGQNLKQFLKISGLLDEVPEEIIDNKFIEKGVRVIPIAPIWLPQNRILIELILEYLLGRIPEELVKKIFYSAFIKMFNRQSIIYLNISYYQKEEEEKTSNTP
ncbi:MAG: hypothetical protein ACP6IP_05750 [Candidatus Njordarchaeia archaeon]